jgi:hypothetical protein
MKDRSTPRRQLRRRMSHAAVGLALAATLGMSGPGGTAQAAADPACEPAGAGGGSAARVDFGVDPEVDPNSVSAEQAAALDAQLDRHVDRLASQGKLRPDGQLKAGRKPIRIRTFVHVLKRNNGAGGVTKKQVRRQIGVMNKAYAGRTSQHSTPSRFRFVLKKIDVTRNNAWYDWSFTPDGTREDAQARKAKRALHRGGYRDLNLYVARLSGGLLGYATFPDGPLALDGVVVHASTLPGGSKAPFNRGDTATHEVGHWLALYHTFQGGCEAPGDLVDDTPYQQAGRNVYFCGDYPGTPGNPLAIPNDTCDQPGRDPVRNFMSYGDDRCLNQFTAGQVTRQQQAWWAFRAGR